MEIRKNLVDSSKYGTKCPYTMNPEFITIHNTYNDATAANEVAYMIRNNNEVSFHIAIDDKEAVQGLPLERNAWACGDGNGAGNRKSISVEICYSLSGGNRYYKAEDNAAIIVAQLMKQYSIPISKVRTHQSWNGKYCPHRMLAEGRWNNFIERVQNAYNGGGKNVSVDNGVRVKTGGFRDVEASKKLLEYALDRKWWVEPFVNNGEFYYITGGLYEPQLSEFEKWMKDNGWWCTRV
ncbi:peptidoglycan recognition protein family protein [Bacillus mycoides]|uniref:peptidoglycan recognition protein family protein n=1 Tax=Bacillus mycoides TaxID=1405 RepID=UPI0011A5584D|nr:N-acetylmuramoyl-L-alanine amidase [Bacillus mycoides]